MGRALADGSGRPLSLDGVNLGGWLLWEGWIWGGPIRLLHLSDLSQRHIQEKLTEIAGADAAPRLRARRLPELHRPGGLGAHRSAWLQRGSGALRARLLDDDAGWAVLDGILDAAERKASTWCWTSMPLPAGQSQYFIADHAPIRSSRTTRTSVTSVVFTVTVGEVLGTLSRTPGARLRRPGKPVPRCNWAADGKARRYRRRPAPQRGFRRGHLG